MKHEIRIIKSETEPDEVLIKKFKLFRNRHGYWCYRFDTPNNKRLEECLYSSDELWFATEHGSTIIIKLIPQNQKEEDELNNIGSNYCIRHLRWQFEVLRLPDDDFYDDEELKLLVARREKIEQAT
jgi:hypothetical protein